MNEDKNWISVTEQLPSFTSDVDVRGGEKTTDLVNVKFNDGSTGEGVYRDNPWRSSWMTRDDDNGFLFNQAWGGKLVTHWKLKK